MSTTLGLVKGKGNMKMIVSQGFLVSYFNVLPTGMYVHCVCVFLVPGSSMVVSHHENVRN